MILASEDDYQIKANRKVDTATVYNSCGSIQRRMRYSIEQSKRSKKLLISWHIFWPKWRNACWLESLLEISINIYQVTLFPGYDDDNEDNSENFTCSQIYPSERLKSTTILDLCMLNETWHELIALRHFIFIKDLGEIKHHLQGNKLTNT